MWMMIGGGLTVVVVEGAVVLIAGVAGRGAGVAGREFVGNLTTGVVGLVADGVCVGASFCRDRKSDLPACREKSPKVKST